MEQREIERRRQMEHEINWLKEKLKTVKKPRHRKDLERQIKEREYNLDLGILTSNVSENK